jgi:hypothetical protein
VYGGKEVEMLKWIEQQGCEFSCGVIQDAPGDGDWYVHGVTAYGQGKTFQLALQCAMQDKKP